jgi:hypothetical protein
MPSVLLRLAGLNAFRHDAQLDPPGRQSCQARLSVATERCSVISADPAGQPEFAEGGHEDGLTVNRVGGVQAQAAEQVTAVVIGDRQRIDRGRLALRGTVRPWRFRIAPMVLSAGSFSLA